MIICCGCPGKWTLASPGTKDVRVRGSSFHSVGATNRSSKQEALARDEERAVYVPIHFSEPSNKWGVLLHTFGSQPPLWALELASWACLPSVAFLLQLREHAGIRPGLSLCCHCTLYGILGPSVTFLTKGTITTLPWRIQWQNMSKAFFLKLAHSRHSNQWKFWASFLSSSLIWAPDLLIIYFQQLFRF